LPDWIAAHEKHDRDGFGGVCRRECRGLAAAGSQHRHPLRDKLGCERGEALVFAEGPAVLNAQVAAFNIAILGEAVAERLHQVTGILRRSGVEITDERLLVLRAAIFREHKGRPGERADKFSTSHATIPSP
jgi:hypothetical protein